MWCNSTPSPLVRYPYCNQRSVSAAYYQFTQLPIVHWHKNTNWASLSEPHRGILSYCAINHLQLLFVHIIHKWLNTLRTHTTNSLPPRWPRTQTTHGPTYSMVGELGASAWQQRSHLSMPFNYCGLTHSSCKATRYMDRHLQWLPSCIVYTAILCTQCYVMRYTASFPNLAWSAFSVLEMEDWGKWKGLGAFIMWMKSHGQQVDVEGERHQQYIWTLTKAVTWYWMGFTQLMGHLLHVDLVHHEKKLSLCIRLNSMWSHFVSSLVPSPSQLSVAMSMVKREKAWYITWREWHQGRNIGRKT